MNLPANFVSGVANVFLGFDPDAGAQWQLAGVDAHGNIQGGAYDGAAFESVPDATLNDGWIAANIVPAGIAQPLRTNVMSGLDATGQPMSGQAWIDAPTGQLLIVPDRWMNMGTPTDQYAAWLDPAQRAHITYVLYQYNLAHPADTGGFWDRWAPMIIQVAAGIATSGAAMGAIGDVYSVSSAVVNGDLSVGEALAQLGSDASSYIENAISKAESLVSDVTNQLTSTVQTGPTDFTIGADSAATYVPVDVSYTDSFAPPNVTETVTVDTQTGPVDFQIPGASVDSAGNATLPDGSVIPTQGTVLPDGTIQLTDGSTIAPSGDIAVASISAPVATPDQLVTQNNFGLHAYNAQMNYQDILATRDPVLANEYTNWMTLNLGQAQDELNALSASGFDPQMVASYQAELDSFQPMLAEARNAASALAPIVAAPVSAPVAPLPGAGGSSLVTTVEAGAATTGGAALVSAATGGGSGATDFVIPGATVDAAGNATLPDGTVIPTQGTVASDGTIVLPDGTTVAPDGTTTLANGQVVSGAVGSAIKTLASNPGTLTAAQAAQAAQAGFNATPLLQGVLSTLANSAIGTAYRAQTGQTIQQALPALFPTAQTGTLQNLLSGSNLPMLALLAGGALLLVSSKG